MSDDMATTIEREAAQRPGRPSPAAPEQPEPAKSGGNKRTVFIIMGVVLLGLVAVGVRRWIYSLSHVSTDNAQVDGPIIPILPKVGGYVVEVRSDEKRSAKAADTLVELSERGARPSGPQPVLHAYHRPLGRGGEQEERRDRSAGATGSAAHERGAAQRRVGHGEPEGDADGQRHSGRPRGFHGGRVPGAAREGARGEPVARDGG